MLTTQPEAYENQVAAMLAEPDDDGSALATSGAPAPDDDDDTVAATSQRHAACLRCKQLKVKCIKEEGKDCARCLRSKETCLKAAPSRQGKRKRVKTEPAELLKPSPQWKSCTDNPEVVAQCNAIEIFVNSAPTWSQERVLDQRFLRAAMTEIGADEASDLLRGLLGVSSKPPQRAVFWSLRRMAARATALHSNALFERTLRLAASCNFSFSAILHGLETTEMKPSPEEFFDACKLCCEHYGEERGPRDVTAFAVARRLFPTPEGRSDTFANSVFLRRVCDVERLDDVQLASPWEAFIHPDDAAHIPTSLGRVLAISKNLDPDTTEPVCEFHATVIRVALKNDDESGTRQYVACDAEVHFGVPFGVAMIGVVFWPITNPEKQLAANKAAASASALAHPSYAPPVFPRPVQELDMAGTVGPFAPPGSGGKQPAQYKTSADCLATVGTSTTGGTTTTSQGGSSSDRPSGGEDGGSASGGGRSTTSTPDNGSGGAAPAAHAVAAAAPSSAPGGGSSQQQQQQQQQQ